jgi:ABC-type lipoprotein release transport system permease subunit
MERFRTLFWIVFFTGLAGIALGWFLGRLVISTIQEWIR